MLDAVITRELGALEIVGADVVPTVEEQPTSQLGSVPATRAEGPIIDEAAAERAREVAGAAAAVEAGAPQAAPTPTLIARLKLWMRRLVESVQRPDGPQFAPGRRAFGKSALDAVQLGALCKLIGTCGMHQLEGVVLDAAADTPVAIGGVLRANKELLANIAMTFERTRQLDHGTIANLTDLNVLLASCRALGITLAARTLLLEGIRSAKSELLPPAVASFVHGLGMQQLPDGQRAGMVLPAVTDVLSSFGLITGADVDAPAVQMLIENAGIEGADSASWASLPYALALMLTLPEWGVVHLSLQEDSVSGNVHCLVHALHALLCLAEPHTHSAQLHLPAEAAAHAGGRLAHRRFLEVAALILVRQREVLFSGQIKPQEVPQRERMLATVVLLLEQLVQLAAPLGYGDLQAFLPYTLVLSSYTATSQPVTLSANGDGGGLHAMGGGPPTDRGLMRAVSGTL